MGMRSSRLAFQVTCLLVLASLILGACGGAVPTPDTAALEKAQAAAAEAQAQADAARAEAEKALQEAQAEIEKAKEGSSEQ